RRDRDASEKAFQRFIQEAVRENNLELAECATDAYVACPSIGSYGDLEDVRALIVALRTGEEAGAQAYRNWAAEVLTRAPSSYEFEQAVNRWREWANGLTTPATLQSIDRMLCELVQVKRGIYIDGIETKDWSLASGLYPWDKIVSYGGMAVDSIEGVKAAQ